MSTLAPIVLLVAGVVTVATIARRFGVAAPVPLVVAGVVASFVPGVPAYRLQPDLVLVFILPPLIYATSITTSLPGIRANLRPIGLLAVGLVLFTVAVVAVVAKLVVPGLPLAAAFALGAIVAPPDAVSATAVARGAGLSRRMVTVLEGESLMNDATALVTYRVAVGAVGAGGVSLLSISGRFALAAVGGVVIGFAVATLVGFVRQRITSVREDPLLDITLSLLTPFFAYLPAEEVQASGVLSVVICGLILGHRRSRHMRPVSRLTADAVWGATEFVLQGVVFTLIGLQLADIVRALSGSLTTAALTSGAVVLAVVLARFVWMYPAVYLTRLLPRVRRRDPAPRWQVPTVLSWAGMRGVVSLAAAFALPENFPRRDLLVFVVLVVILTTLLGQGLTLPALIRRLGLAEDTKKDDALQEASAQQAAGDAAARRLDELMGEEGGLPPGVEERLRDGLEKRGYAAWERLGSSTRESPSQAYRRLRREMLESERTVFIGLRDEGSLDNELMRRVERELDLEEAMLRE